MNKNKPNSSGYQMITKFIGTQNSSLLTGYPEKVKNQYREYN